MVYSHMNRCINRVRGEGSHFRLEDRLNIYRYLTAYKDQLYNFKFQYLLKIMEKLIDYFSLQL